MFRVLDYMGRNRGEFSTCEEAFAEIIRLGLTEAGVLWCALRTRQSITNHIEV